MSAHGGTLLEPRPWPWAPGAAPPAALPVAPGDAATSGPWPIAQLVLLLAYLAAMVQLCIAPFISRNDIGLLKYLPVVIGLCALAFHLCTCRGALPQLLSIMAYHRPMLLLTVAVLGGSIYARLAGGVEVSFRPQALSLVAFFVSCHLGAIADERRFVRAYVVLLTLASVYIFCIAWTFFPRHVVHENLYLFGPTIVFCGLLTRNLFVRWMAYAFMAMFAVVGLKNTTFIITGIGIYSLYLFNQPAVRAGLRKPFSLRGALLLTLVAGLGYALLDLVKSQVTAFSSGNAEFRSFLYRTKWRMFQDSPLWGDLFTTTPNVEFSLFQVQASTQFLPSHSDLLDILAHGGVIAALCLAAFVVRVFRDGMHECDQPSSGRMGYAVRVCLLAICASALVSATFNPVLGNPANGFMFWSCFGVLASLTQRRRFAAAAAAAAQPPVPHHPLVLHHPPELRP